MTRGGQRPWLLRGGRRRAAARNLAPSLTLLQTLASSATAVEARLTRRCLVATIIGGESPNRHHRYFGTYTALHNSGRPGHPSSHIVHVVDAPGVAQQVQV